MNGDYTGFDFGSWVEEQFGTLADKAGQWIDYRLDDVMGLSQYPADQGIETIPPVDPKPVERGFQWSSPAGVGVGVALAAAAGLLLYLVVKK